MHDFGGGREWSRAGLRIVEALSVRWGWRPAADGKAVFAVVPEGR
jgi:hypothetical protein